MSDSCPAWKMSARNKILAHCMTNIYQWVSGQSTAHPSHLAFKPVSLHELDEISEILAGSLYLSGSMPLNAAKITEMGFSAIVCAVTELEERILPKDYFSLELRMAYVRLADSEGSDMSIYFDPITEFIYDEIRKGGKVLVHCVAGMSRSAALVIAYLMRYRNLKLWEAYEYVVKRRKIVHPNEGFIYQLDKYEHSLKGSSSSSEVATVSIESENAG